MSLAWLLQMLQQLALLSSLLAQITPLRLENCSEMPRPLQLSQDTAPGTVLVTVLKGLQLRRSAQDASEYLVLRNDSIVLRRPVIASELPFTQNFLCGANLLRSLPFVLNLDSLNIPAVRILELPAEIRVWRFTPAGTQLYRIRAKVSGGCAEELEYRLLGAPPWLQVNQSDGQLTLTAPLPPGAPDRMTVRCRIRDPSTNYTAEANIQLMFYQLWYTPVVLLEVRDAPCALPIRYAGHLLEADANVTVLWRSELVASDTPGHEACMALLEAELGGARERMLLRVACRLGNASANNATAWPDSSVGYVSGESVCTPVAIAVTLAPAALGALLAITFCCVRRSLVICQAASRTRSPAAAERSPLAQSPV